MTAPNAKHWRSKSAVRLMNLAGEPKSIDEAVDRVVQRLLDGIQCPSTDLQSVFPKLNIDKVVRVDMPFSGKLIQSPNGYVIEVSESLSAARRRFTIAHEMAHALMDQTGRRCARRGRELERLCDLIATELLMPRRVFRQHAESQVTMQGILALSKTFECSVLSTGIRCFEFFPVGLFLVDREISKTQCWGLSKFQVKRFLNDNLDSIDHGTFMKQSFMTLRGMPTECTIEARRLGKTRYLGLVRRNCD